MANTCRISFICVMILLLFTNQSALSYSARLRLIDGRNLVHEKQHHLSTLEEIEKSDRARLDFLFRMIDEAETNQIVIDSLPLPCLRDQGSSY
ncbi:unnamed protein product [Microthlaspi erraticum]|uniref:Uncharacterized protein n=1 Tax=Microthlaspi erraticum TaxID=1685480 RepID=A0A6D2HY69_9BRAS|nr:unnamed protein product [Microthlaspi erraticum]